MSKTGAYSPASLELKSEMDIKLPIKLKSVMNIKFNTPGPEAYTVCFRLIRGTMGRELGRTLVGAACAWKNGNEIHITAKGTDRLVVSLMSGSTILYQKYFQHDIQIHPLLDMVLARDEADQMGMYILALIIGKSTYGISGGDILVTGKVTGKNHDQGIRSVSFLRDPRSL